MVRKYSAFIVSTDGNLFRQAMSSLEREGISFTNAATLYDVESVTAEGRNVLVYLRKGGLTSGQYQEAQALNLPVITLAPAGTEEDPAREPKNGERLIRKQDLSRLGQIARQIIQEKETSKTPIEARV